MSLSNFLPPGQGHVRVFFGAGDGNDGGGGPGDGGSADGNGNDGAGSSGSSGGGRGGDGGDGPGNGNDSGINGATSDGNGDDGSESAGGFGGIGGGGGSSSSQSAAVDAALNDFFGEIDSLSSDLAGMSNSSLQSLIGITSAPKESTLSRYGKVALKGAFMGWTLSGFNPAGAVTGAATGLGKEALSDAVDAAFSAAKAAGATDAEAEAVAKAAEPALNEISKDSGFINGLSKASEMGVTNSFIDNYLNNPTDWESTWEDQTNYDNGMPTDIPARFIPGLENYVTGINSNANTYFDSAQALEDDYKAFEQTFGEKFDEIMSEYNARISTMPQVNLTMPETMGGGKVALAPKVHSAMYGDQLAARNSTLMNQANTQLAGLGSRDALAKNRYGVGQSSLSDSLMPTQIGLDLYKMERAGELGIQQAQAGVYEPSTLSTWAPVVGSVLSSDAGTKSLSGAWDFVSKLFSGDSGGSSPVDVVSYLV